ncbi:hypothetical protein BD289DRAFT_442531 [Coniella lustricola]|uniref:Secreted protein n=1 Tax=Coniella lustricola TaxID=2025994 RepID=A0A2T2ZY55_9PEZI|nr:hypothetical protein BD289DRAFT_442531 [Coniella lustricola]
MEMWLAHSLCIASMSWGDGMVCWSSGSHRKHSSWGGWLATRKRSCWGIPSAAKLDQSAEWNC